MAQLLVKAVDARQRTVAEWRDWMNTVELPAAQAFFVAHPQAAKAIADLKRLEEYQAAKSRLAGHVSGQSPLTPEDLLTVGQVIFDYEAAPLSRVELDSVRAHHIATLDATTPGETNSMKWRGPSLADLWKWHKEQVDVEATKTDTAKSTELAIKDLRGCFKRGMIVGVMPDEHVWGGMEGLPIFVVIKIPLVSVDKTRKYIETWTERTGTDAEGNPIIETRRRRLWQLRWADLPAVVRNKLATQGSLTIRASAVYTGPYDFTWAQVRAYIRNLMTGLDETADL